MILAEWFRMPRSLSIRNMKTGAAGKMVRRHHHEVMREAGFYRGPDDEQRRGGGASLGRKPLAKAQSFHLNVFTTGILFAESLQLDAGSVNCRTKSPSPSPGATYSRSTLNNNTRRKLSRHIDAARQCANDIGSLTLSAAARETRLYARRSRQPIRAR